MMKHAAHVLLLSLAVACGGTSTKPDSDAGSPPDAAAVADAGMVLDAATPLLDAGQERDASNPCDQDGDGFVRASPACPTGLPADCADDDPHTAPGLAECRDVRSNGCNVDGALAAALGMEEVGRLATTTDNTVVGSVRSFSGMAVSLAFGQFVRAVTVASAEHGAAVTLLAPDPHHMPVTLELLEDGPGYAALGHLDGMRGPLLALAGRDGTADLLDASLAFTRVLVHSPPAAASSVDGVAVLTSPEPTLVVSRNGSTAGSLTFASANSTHVVPLPASNVIPWVGAAGDLAIHGTNVLRAASRGSSAAQEIALAGTPVGGFAMVALEDAHLVLVETTAGLRAVRFPRCTGTVDCASQGVESAAFQYQPVNAEPLAMTRVGAFSDLLAVAVVEPQGFSDAQRVELVFIHASDPATEVKRMVVMGEGALDPRPVGQVGGLAVDLGNLYGGDFIMVTATVSGPGFSEQRSTGVVLCQVL